MLTLLAHVGQPPQPHDLWGAWSLEPSVVAGLAVAAWWYRRGRASGRSDGHGRDARAWYFAGALLAVAVALVSPLDALSGALASAHMVQHVLLLLVAAPLLALSRPAAALVRGLPRPARRASGRLRRRLRLGHVHVNPFTVWLVHVATIWVWHAAVLYDAALEHTVLHLLEHGLFLVTAWWFWHLVLGARTSARVPHGLGVLLVFATAMQGVLLSALLTFANEPWYDGYATTTTPWGLDPLADQQLAGVIMWIPAGGIYLAVALGLLIAWLRSAEREPVSPPRR